MRFLRYQHVEKWGSPLTEGIEHGTTHVFPKLDGKCTSLFNDNGRMAIGGRKCEDSKQSTPHVFRHFEGDDKYKRFIEDHPEITLYGEFGNKTTIGYYKKEVYGDFFVFDVVIYDENDKPAYIPYNEYTSLLEQYDIKYIPRIGVIENITEDDFEKLIELATEHFVDKELAQGKQAEGIVIKNYDYANKHGKQIWAKVVTEEYKKRKHNRVRINSDGEVDTRSCEQILVDETLTDAFVEKEIQKFTEANGTLVKQQISTLFKYIWETWVSEEILNMLAIMKKYKKDLFEPKELDRLMKEKVKMVIPHLFQKD